MFEDTAALSPLECATEITIAWLSNPNTRASADEVLLFLQRLHSVVLTLNSDQTPQEQEQAEPSQEYTPAVTARKSLASPERIISLIDGKPYKTLKRHLAINGLTPAQYRERYGLKADYPMVAPAYAETRRQLAKKIGLGRKPGEKPAKASAAPAPKPALELKPARAAKPAPAAKPAAAKRAASAAAEATPKPATSPKPAAAKSVRRKKLGLQFGGNGAAPSGQS